MLTSVIIAYVVGALPTGYWLSKWAKGIDIRQHGSGNTGATNTARLLGKKYFTLVFLIDVGKAWVTLYGCDRFLFQEGPPAYRVMALLVTASVLLIGNAYSCFISFQGGKGVSTALGIVAYLYPPVFVFVFCCLWLIVFLVTRQVFIASLVAAIAGSLVGPLVSVLDVKYFIFLVFMCVWLIVRHHGNIKRWWLGGAEGNGLHR